MASANLGWTKFPPKKTNAWAKSAQKPNDQASFHDLKSAKTGIFSASRSLFSLLSNITLLSKIAKNLMPGQFLPPKTLCQGTN